MGLVGGLQCQLLAYHALVASGCAALHLGASLLAAGYGWLLSGAAVLAASAVGVLAALLLAAAVPGSALTATGLRENIWARPP